MMDGFINLAEVELLIREKPKLREFYVLIRGARELHSVVMDLNQATQAFTTVYQSQQILSPIILFYLQGAAFVALVRAFDGMKMFQYVDGLEHYKTVHPTDDEIIIRILSIRNKVVAHNDGRIGSTKEIDQFIKDRIFVTVKNGMVVGTSAPFSRHLPTLNEIPSYLELLGRIQKFYGTNLRSKCQQIMDMSQNTAIKEILTSCTVFSGDPLSYMFNNDKNIEVMIK